MTPAELKRLRESIQAGVIKTLAEYLTAAPRDEWDSDYESWKGPEVEWECMVMLGKTVAFLEDR